MLSFTVGWLTAIVVEILMGVLRFCIKICSETSLVVDDSCVKEHHGLLGLVSGKLDGTVK